jgi:hypothetical protein
VRIVTPAVFAGRVLDVGVVRKLRIAVTRVVLGRVRRDGPGVRAGVVRDGDRLD